MKRFIGSVAAATAVLMVLLTASPAGATPPGDNGRIAFRRYFNQAHKYGAIFTINPDGTGFDRSRTPEGCPPYRAGLGLEWQMDRVRTS